MQKDFDSWNEKKKEINKKRQYRLYHARDIWWCSLGVNVGYEQDGKDKNFLRPVLILKGISKQTCFVIPISTKVYSHRYRISIGNVTGKEACVVLSQMKLIDTSRLIEKIVVLEKSLFQVIRKSTKDML